MIELMAVLIILGLLFTVVARNYVHQTDNARVTTTMANLKLLHQAVQQFKMDTGRYPTAEEGLNALITQPSDVTGWEPGGYLESTELPRDGWGNEFYYELYPESGKPFVIKSLGADGQDGGEGYDADLYSTDAVLRKGSAGAGAGTGTGSGPR
jgi:general secretion pathway protein G